MPIDTSIYQNYLKPPKSIAEYGAEMDAADQNRMTLESGRMNLLAAKQAQADEQAVRAAYQQPGFDPQSDTGIMELMRLNPVAGRAAAEARQKALKAQADLGHVAAQTDSQRASAQKSTIEAAGTRLKQYRDTLDFIDTPEAAARWITAQFQDPLISGQMAALGSPEQAVSRIPRDPAGFQKWRQQAAMGMEKHIAEMRQQGVADESARHNKENERIQIRGQNMVDARAKEATSATVQAVTYQTDADGNLVAVPSRIAPGSAVRAIPVMAPGGVKPLQGKGSGMTEDQAKATGWLVQANNAWANMQKAMEADPSAAQPGFNDALAGIPSFGLTEGAANMMRGAERQKFMQGASSLSEALLRAATGAGVNADEARQKVRELTPVWGEKSDVTKQKMDAIPTYIESLKVRAGPGAKKAEGIRTGATPTAPAIDDLVNKYRSK